MKPILFAALAAICAAASTAMARKDGGYCGGHSSAFGVVLALGLTLWATRRAGARLAPGLPGDRARIVAALVIVLVSIPWITAELGFFVGNRVSKQRCEAIVRSR